ncbi:MAG TPA: right-handed parallel beta-helix repeat-containing protein [Anaerohalosphaeraceae bacterium]|nr:right-handed parallel beta-helix repeat-containing protein [Anaerohalosphaeraceae bacterium]
MKRLIAVIISLCAASSAVGRTWYVAPDGNDTWSGQSAQAEGTDGPLATLAAAVDASRKAPAGEPRQIIIAGGRYHLGAPVTLDGRDNGLVIRGQQDAQVVLLGGKPITGWKPDGDGMVAAALPEVIDGKWDFRALVVNGRLCPRARLPEEGTFTHLSEFNVPWMSSTGGGWQRKPTQEELTTLRYRPEDIGAWFDVRNAEITVYHMWDESMVGVASIDRQRHIITFSSPTGHPAGAFGVKKYVLWNLRQGMTRPGQWYLDRTAGKVVYRPLPGEDMNAATVLAPTMDSIIRIRGAENVTIQGMTLSIAGTPLVAGGFGAGRFDGAIDLSGAKNCKLIDLEICNVAGQGIKAHGPGLEVRNCHIHDTGACGLKFASDNARIVDNHIHHIGRIYPSAIGLQSGGNGFHVVHNAVHDTPYSAITGGGRDNLYEYNLMYHAMQELHDGAGIYIFGGKGVVILNNFIRDIIDTGGYGASAYYLDETCEGCIVERNLSVNIARPSHNHMAKGNIIRNNVFVVDGDATLTWPRSSDYTFEKNIVQATGSITFTNFAGITTFRDNVLYSGTGDVSGLKLVEYTSQEWFRIKTEDRNIFLDPQITEYRTGRVRLAPDSPAIKLGIEIIDVSTAGPRTRD